MEYQGIITGIGDNNLIKPELDAIIYDFIIGKNTILEGLVLNGNNLSAGACILCGYRGIIEENKTLDNTTYVYGKFTINFDDNIEDSFEIVTSSTPITSGVNPTEIAVAGTYYLLLYVNGEMNDDLETLYPYPKNAQNSVTTDIVQNGSIIDKDVTATTQPVNDDSEKVATTQYVHNQIQEELELSTYEDTKDAVLGNILNATLTIKRKARFAILNIQFEGHYLLSNTEVSGSAILNINDIPDNFRPLKNITCGVVQGHGDNKLLQLGTIESCTITTGGKIALSWNVYDYNVNSPYGGYAIKPLSIIVGYECY